MSQENNGNGEHPEKFICVHGHFYQPPRENPWLEDIEVQDSAHPAHDWNERVHMECYAPNTASRLLDPQGRIAELVDNYAKISFNFGPTLLSWMAAKDPAAYQKILESDRKSVEARSGHGNALAQVYNHIIMPLANRRDKITQVVWGIRDFEKRFGRPPEGMWLAETAVDSETLEILADLGIKFTILSPRQARAVRPLGDPEAPWQDASDGRIDPSRAYRWSSPAGLSIDIFFYDGPISQAVAFEGLLNNGEFFAGRLMNGFSDQRGWAQLMHIATDGESYGHHHRFGDMALAYALKKIEREGSARLTNYGEFLSLHPSEWQVQIVENSSWSCAHGVERWRSDCGCRIGYHAHWNQAWRAPLRDSLNWLRDSLDALYESKAAAFLSDPWQARNDYIDVIFDRSAASMDAFFRRHRVRELDPAERVDALRLLEMQRHVQLMFTSCGWFFDELSGIEGTTVLRFAARALQLAGSFQGGSSLEEGFLSRLAAARSNIPEFGDGRAVYQRFIKPQSTDLPRVAAHVALSGLLQDGPAAGASYCYAYDHLDRWKAVSGTNTLSVGRLRVVSDVTRESMEAAYAALHLGGHDFHAVLKSFPDARALAALWDELKSKFEGGTLTEVLRLLSQHFDPRGFSLQDLFLEERRRLLRGILKDVLGRFDDTYRRLVEDNRKMLTYLRESQVPIPEAFRLALQYVLNRDFEDALEKFEGEPEAADRAVELKREAEKFGVTLDFQLASDIIRRRVDRLLEDMRRKTEPETARKINGLLALAERLDLGVFLWHAENVFYELWNGRLKDSPLLRQDGQPFLQLAGRLRQAVPVEN